MTASVPPESVAAWKAMAELWESDNTQVNPFVVTMKSMFFFCLQVEVRHLIFLYCR